MSQPAPIVLPFFFGLSHFLRRLVPLAATGLFLSVSWFDVGADLNVPALYWAENRVAQILIGLSAGLMFGYVWLLNAIVDDQLNVEVEPREDVAGWNFSIARCLMVTVVAGIAVYDVLFAKTENGGPSALNRGLAEGLALIILGVWLVAPAKSRVAFRFIVPSLPMPWWTPIRDHLAITWVPLALLLATPALYAPAQRWGVPVGVALGFGLAWGVAGLIRLLDRRRKRQMDTLAAAPLLGLSKGVLEWLAGILFGSLLILFISLSFLPRQWLPPAFAVSMLFGLLTGVHGAVWFYGGRWKAIVALALGAWYVFCAGTEFKLRLPNLGAEYADRLPLTDDEEPEIDLSPFTPEEIQAEVNRVRRLCQRLHRWLDFPEAERVKADAYVARLNHSDLVGHYETLLNLMFEREWQLLDSWRTYMTEQTKQSRPRLVVVATSGGANRSALWTAVVLSKLEEKFPGTSEPGKSHFPKHVRLISGASGGMVGAAHYVASLKEHGHGGTFEPAKIAGDYLTPIINTAVFREVPRLMWPCSYERDRGHVLDLALEQTTPQLASTFADLDPGERKGWRPSLVFTPMMVEDGRRLIISNRLLPQLTMSQGSLLIGDRPARNEKMAAYGKWSPANQSSPEAQRSATSTKTAPPTTRRTVRQRSSTEQDVYSRSALEMFRLYPEARSRFRISTAARLNASFPYASPAIEFPVEPSRRLVDAGYYDVYGVNVAARWIASFREWIKDNTSGVVLVQIRDTRSQYRRRHVGIDDRSESALARQIGQSVEWITGPPSGAGAARNSVTSFRNDEQLQGLHEWFQKETPGSRYPFFTTVVFERRGDVGMNWYLSQADKDDILAGFDPNEPGNPNPTALARLKDWWTSK